MGVLSSIIGLILGWIREILSALFTLLEILTRPIRQLFGFIGAVVSFVSILFLVFFFFWQGSPLDTVPDESGATPVGEVVRNPDSFKDRNVTVTGFADPSTGGVDAYLVNSNMSYRIDLRCTYPPNKLISGRKYLVKGTVKESNLSFGPDLTLDCISSPEYVGEHEEWGLDRVVGDITSGAVDITLMILNQTS